MQHIALHRNRSAPANYTRHQPLRRQFRPVAPMMQQQPMMQRGGAALTLDTACRDNLPLRQPPISPLTVDTGGCYFDFDAGGRNTFLEEASGMRGTSKNEFLRGWLSLGVFSNTRGAGRGLHIKKH